VVRIPRHEELHAPEFPKGLEWLGAAFVKVDALAGRAAPLVEFFDVARINSVRTLPYTSAWHARYREAGLRVIGVHSPGYSFGRDRDAVARAVERLGVPYPVVLDPELAVWRRYGNRGWPARYLFGPDLKLRYVHYGEGDYEGAELAIQDALRELDPAFEPSPRLEPLRPEDAPGVRLEPQTPEVRLPAERARLELAGRWDEGRDWIEAAEPGASARVEFRAGAAYAVLSGAGVAEPGLHETAGTVVAERAGLRLHGFQFAPLAPPA
jgi:hypothetical protein